MKGDGNDGQMVVAWEMTKADRVPDDVWSKKQESARKVIARNALSEIDRDELFGMLGLI